MSRSYGRNVTIVGTQPRLDVTGGSLITTDRVTLSVSSGRVVLIGWDIFHSIGAEFSAVFRRAPWWWYLVPRRWREPKIRELRGATPGERS